MQLAWCSSLLVSHWGLEPKFIFFFLYEICAVIGCHLHAKIQTTWLPTMLRYHYMEFFSKLFQEIVPLAGEE